MINLKIAALAIAISFVASNFATWKITSNYINRGVELEKEKDKTAIAEGEVKNQVKSSEISNEVKIAEKIVKVKGDAVIREVPVYVKENCEVDGSMSDSWRVLHNKGAEVEYP
jgi:hypothetical protein